MKANIFALCMIIAVVSLMGFCVENIWLAATKGYIDNRNMYLPFLIGHGLAIAAIYLLFGTPANLQILGKTIHIGNEHVQTAVYFLVVMLCVSVGEILLGTFVEKTCHFYWWDYTRIPGHITRYTSIPTSSAFACIIVLFMQKVFTPLYAFFLSWSYTVLRNTAVIIMTLLVGDYLYNAYLMYKEKSMQRRWKIDVSDRKLYQLLHS